jgi:hypothetical protein
VGNENFCGEQVALLHNMPARTLEKVVYGGNPKEKE